LTALIRSQVVPYVVLPAHEVRYRPPRTLVATDTFVPALITTRRREVTDGVFRRFAAHMAAFVTVAPSTSRGAATDATANSSIADTNDVITRVGNGGRPERRA
jgi:hypothetical protein